MKYGRIDQGAPDISQDAAALKDLCNKGEITKEEYISKLSILQTNKLLYIARTNGGYIPGRRAMNRYKKEQQKASNNVESLTEAKAQQEILKQQQGRDQFLTEIKEFKEKEKAKEAAKETESEAVE